jgi:hypothetical protein
VQLLDVDLPQAIQDDITKANKAEKPWEPSEKDLATLKSSWKTLKPRAKSEYSRIEWKVYEHKYLEGGLTPGREDQGLEVRHLRRRPAVSSPGQGEPQHHHLRGRQDERHADRGRPRPRHHDVRTFSHSDRHEGQLQDVPAHRSAEAKKQDK